MYKHGIIHYSKEGDACRKTQLLFTFVFYFLKDDAMFPMKGDGNEV